jgi:hypothetical protein
MVYYWCDSSALKTFTFTFSTGPHAKFGFDKAISASRATNRPFKRRRPLWDVDGGIFEGKKKRRLRLNLVTSRLSRPFSIPATNIVNRGISRIAIWAKGRRLDTHSLRKAAIMNRARSCLDVGKTAAKRQALSLRQVKIQVPRNHDVPLPPSPLGLSNYAAFDLEDEMQGNEDCEGGESGCSIIYSDFNIMRPTSMSDDDEYDYLDDLDGIPRDLPEERPPQPPDERFVEIMEEKERQREIYFVKFVT